MIVRTWKATVSTSREGYYFDKVKEQVLPALRAVPGYRGAQFLRRSLDVRVEIMVLTYWESMESVEALTGGDPSTAYLPTDVVAILESFDAGATHYEAVISDEGDKE
jgi:hypothetical protein